MENPIIKYLEGGDVYYGGGHSFDANGFDISGGEDLIDEKFGGEIFDSYMEYKYMDGGGISNVNSPIRRLFLRKRRTKKPEAKSSKGKMIKKGKKSNSWKCGAGDGVNEEEADEAEVFTDDNGQDLDGIDEESEESDGLIIKYIAGVDEEPGELNTTSIADCIEGGDDEASDKETSDEETPASPADKFIEEDNEENLSIGEFIEDIDEISEEFNHNQSV